MLLICGRGHKGVRVEEKAFSLQNAADRVFREGSPLLCLLTDFENSNFRIFGALICIVLSAETWIHGTGSHANVFMKSWSSLEVGPASMVEEEGHKHKCL